jgi:hypothetical protein
MLRIESVLPVLALLLALSTGTAASRHRDNLAVSTADAQKHGVFLYSTIHVTPAHFVWEGHKVLLSDSWLELVNGYFYLSFKFEVDGSRLGEARIAARKGGKELYFEKEGVKSDPGSAISDLCC